MRRVVLAALAACLACLDDEPCPPEVPLEPGDVPDLRVISANVGNTARSPPWYAYRMQHQDYEDVIGGALRRARADIVALQEVLTGERCTSFVESDPARTCWAARDRPPPVLRLLGDDYSIACDDREGVECVAVHTNFGTIDGVAPGALVIGAAEALPLPGPTCDYLSGECYARPDACDRESTVSRVRVSTARGPLDVVHVHPNAAPGNRCRSLQVMQAFGAVREAPALVLGDWNYDPDAAESLVEAAVEARHHDRFRSHHPRDSGCRLASTRSGEALDRVYSDFARGVCTIHRLDHGYRGSGIRLDHETVQCDLADGR